MNHQNRYKALTKSKDKAKVYTIVSYNSRFNSNECRVVATYLCRTSAVLACDSLNQLGNEVPKKNKKFSKLSYHIVTNSLVKTQTLTLKDEEDDNNYYYNKEWVY